MRWENLRKSQNVEDRRAEKYGIPTGNPPSGPLPPNTPPVPPTPPTPPLGPGESTPTSFYFPDSPNLPKDPLLITLGNTIDLSSVSTSDVHFDYGNDGFAEATGWITGNTGLVIYDSNENNNVDSSDELIGSSTIGAYEALSLLDTNDDGIISGLDNNYSNFRIWFDQNNDGISTVNELTTLSEAGALSLNIDYKEISNKINGNLIYGQSTFTYANGNIGQTAAVLFSTNPTFTVYIPPENYNYDDDVEDLPFLFGYGSVKPLDMAMSEDNLLKSLVHSFVINANDMSFSNYVDNVRTIIFQWTSSSELSPLSRGNHIDAREVNALEAFLGEPYNIATSISKRDANVLKSQFDNLVQGIALRLAIQITPSLLALYNAGDEFVLENDYFGKFYDFHLLFGLDDEDRVSGWLFSDFNQSISHLIQRYISIPYESIEDYISHAQSIGAYLNLLQQFGISVNDITSVITSIGSNLMLSNAKISLMLGGFTESLIVGTATSDELVGTNKQDIFFGDGGNDTFVGGAGSDTYIYTRGDGNDTITDGLAGGASDKLILEGIAPSAVMIVRSGDDVTLVFAETTLNAGDGGSVILKNQLTNNDQRGVEQIIFDDGTIWIPATLREMVVAQQITAGDDAIIGTGKADIIEAGLGNDIINGGGGSDTYIYTRGDGHDTITDGFVAGGADKLFLHGILPADITLVRDGNDVTLIIAESMTGSGDAGSILLKNQLVDDDQYGVEQIVFDDQTVWTPSLLRQMVVAQQITAGDDTVTGTGKADVIEAGLGNDTINGGGGSDTYIYTRGDGNDTITDGFVDGANDKLFLQGILPTDVTLVRTDDDVTLVFAESTHSAGDNGSILLKTQLNNNDQRGIEQIIFDDGTIWTPATLRGMIVVNAATPGNDTIIGFSDADIISGGLGNDVLIGKGGSDTYIYALGDGEDTIDDQGSSSSINRLVLNGIDSNDVSVIKNGSNAILLFGDNGVDGRITIIGQFTSTGRMSFIDFDDGSSWSASYIAAISLSPSGTVTHMGTANDDTLNGTSSDDTLQGAGGNDFLDGKSGSDMYLYALGDGNDFIDEANASGIDTLKFVDLNIADVTFARSLTGENDAVVTINSTGATIILQGQMYGSVNGSNYGIERVVFADDTIWDENQLRSAAWFRGTAGSDTLNGTSADETLVGGQGDDILDGKSGSDTYIYADGDGNDFIDEADVSGIDALKFVDLNIADVTFARSPSGANDAMITINSTGETIVLQGQMYKSVSSYNYGIEQLIFGDGTVWNEDQIRAASWYRGTSGNDVINGSGLDDTIHGKEGDDILDGDSGSDTYIYALGDGNDFIDEANVSGTDVLRFVDLNVADLSFARSANGPNDAAITIKATGHTIILQGHMYGSVTSNSYGLERFEFADGTVWNETQFRDATVNAIIGTSANNSISGTAADNVIDGGPGNDVLTGGSGSDTFVFRANFGQDTITDFASGSGSVDIIEFSQSLFDDFSNVIAAATQTGLDTLISCDEGNSVLLKNVALTSLHSDDFRFVA